MLIVIGHVIATAAQREQIIALAIEHCARSRGEPGCLAHNCHVDGEDQMRIVFIEQWQDASALRTHFLKPESAAFAKAMPNLCAAPPVMKIYQASDLPVLDLR